MSQLRIYTIDNDEIVTVAARSPEEAFGIWAEYHMKTCYRNFEDGRVTVMGTAWPDEAPVVKEAQKDKKLVINEITESPLEITAGQLADFLQHPQFICTTDY